MMATRVLYAIDSMHGGGAETSLIEMAPALQRRGVSMSVVTLLDDDNALSARMTRAGVAAHRVRAKTWLGLVAGLREMLRSHQPDILHTSLLRSDVCGRIAALGVDVPVVTSLVNSSYGPEHRSQSAYGSLAVRATQALDVMTAKRTSVFHAISNDVCHVMTKRLLIDPRRVVVAYRGRDEARLGRRSPERRARVRAALGIGEDVPVVLVVGRLDRQKAIEVALEGFSQYRASAPAARMLVVGRDGNAVDIVRETAKKIPAVTLLGHRIDVPDLMCAADCLAFPSRWEGLGGTLIEAMALELPIVASDIAPIREVLDGVEWPLVPVGDARAVAHSLSAVIEGRVDTPRLVAEGRRRFEDLFTAEAAAAQMQAIYDRALGGGGS